MRTAVLFRAAALALALQASSAAQEAPLELKPDLAAAAFDVELPWTEFDQLVLARHALTETGRGALDHLMRARLLDRLAQESNYTVSEAAVDKKWRELELGVVASGEAATLDEYLQKKRVTRARLREFLRLAIVQEDLARQALGIPKERAINGEQQEMWLDQIVARRGTHFPGPPWSDGIAARCGDLQVTLADFLVHLKEQLTVDDIREDCYQALLAKRARARMPDLSSEAFEHALDRELERRRAVTEADPQTRGLTFEQVLGAQGLTPAGLRRDPAVVVGTLAQVWVDRSWGEDGLRRVYADEREEFDRRFGEAYATHLIFLRGARFTNELNPRSFEDAEREMQKLGSQIRTLEDFERLARSRSEDVASRERGGAVGFVARGDELVPEAIREAIFGHPRPEGTNLVGPLRISNPSGLALLWIGDRRPAPSWEEMREHVHNELRRRFIEECLQPEDVVTYLDRE